MKRILWFKIILFRFLIFRLLSYSQNPQQFFFTTISFILITVYFSFLAWYLMSTNLVSTIWNNSLMLVLSLAETSRCGCFPNLLLSLLYSSLKLLASFSNPYYFRSHLLPTITCRISLLLVYSIIFIQSTIWWYVVRSQLLYYYHWHREHRHNSPHSWGKSSQDCDTSPVQRYPTTPFCIWFL